MRQIRRRLDARLAPIIVVRGPRQIGKSTAQMQVLDDLLKAGVDPRRIFKLERIPLDPIELAAAPQLATLAGYLAESIVGAFLCTVHGLDVAWLPERKDEPESISS